MIRNSYKRLQFAPPVRVRTDQRSAQARNAADMDRYRFDPERYIVERLGWTPWRGTADAPGQADVLDAYADALRSQIAAPDAPCQNRIRIASGHTIGKTKIASAIVNHFFDTFAPAICYTYAPSYEQIHDLLWKEIKHDRLAAGMNPKEVYDLELRRSVNHFAKGRATNNARGQGGERIQGQHGPFLLFVVDEAEGVEDYVYDAIESMTSGGLSIVLMLANPRTRTSRFHRSAADPRVASFRISCLSHPNVVTGTEVVPGAVRRSYVEAMIDNGSEQHAEAVDQHDADSHTFVLPWRPDVIYRPDSEFLYRVLGIAPAHIADNTFVPTGRYDAARRRTASGTRPDVARIGVDVARYGKDAGTIYVYHGGALRCAKRIEGQDTNAYALALRQLCLSLSAKGVRDCAIRIDAGGGYGGGVADKIGTDAEVAWAFDRFAVLEVHNNGTPADADAYADKVTELYAHAAIALHTCALIDPPNALEADLCERTYSYVTVRGKDVKQLEAKDRFKARLRRSPDDGDGACLALAPDRIFAAAARAWGNDDLKAFSTGRAL